MVDGDIVESEGGAPAIVVSNVDPSINPNVPLEGRLPENPGEIAVIKDTADKKDLTVGQSGIALATDEGTKPVKLVGIFRYGDVESIGGATVVLTTFADAQRWFEREGETSVVFAKAQDGVSSTQLRDRIRAALPDTDKVETATENAESQSEDIADEITGFLGPALLAFAGVALFVGAFIIFNTFSITVAQRVREFGMTRTLGATRGQVLRNVIGEALVIGILASIIGLLAGIGIARGIQALFDAVGFGLPATGIQIKPRTVIVALLIGVVVTVLASIGPALRATRVPPIAAVQEGAVLPRGRLSRISPYLAVLLLVAGILLFVYALFSDLGATEALLLLAIGAILVFLGVGMLARFIVRPLAKVIGAPIEAAAGTTGHIARANATRNPARTAATAAALMIGVGLVTFVAIFAQGLKDSFTGAIDRVIQGDLILRTQNFDPFPAAAEPATASVPGVAATEFLRFPEIRATPGGSQILNTIDPAEAADVFNFDWRGGASDALFEQLGTDGALIETNLAKSSGLRTGDTFTVTTNRGNSGPFKVLGEYRDPVLFTGITVSDAAADRLDIPPDPSVGVVKFEPGADANAVQQGGLRPHRAAIPDRRGPIQRRVQGGLGEPDRPAPLPALRAPRDQPHHLPLRDRQRARVVDLRAHARDRDAARDRHDPAPDARHRALREHHHRGDRRGAGDRHRGPLRLDPHPGPGGPGHRVLVPGPDADHLPRAGRPRRRAGGDAAGPPGGPPQPAGGPPPRVSSRRSAVSRPSRSSSSMTSGGRKRTVRAEVLLAR